MRGLPPDVLRSVGAVPAHLAGRFRGATGFQQSASGQYFIFDRRSHVVFGLDEKQEGAWEIVHERIQIFSPAGFRIGGYMLPGREKMRVVFENVVVSGIGTLQYTGSSILMSQPETGALVTEYALSGNAVRTFGNLRPTGHEDDRDLHLALNSGIPLVDPTGGFFFVFQTGEPVLRKYDAAGILVFERRMQGREIDDFIDQLPNTWPRRQTSEGELPLVRPTIRSAAVDGSGHVWVAFVAPNSMFFGRNGRLLVTPGLYEFTP